MVSDERHRNPARRVPGKRPVCVREAVGHLWFGDPMERSLEAFGMREGQWSLIGSAEDDDPVCIPPVHAMTVSLAELRP